MDERPPPRDNNKQAPAATSHDSRQMKRRRDGGYFSRSASTPLLLASGLGTRRAGRGASASLPGPVQGWPTPKATNWPRRTAGDPHAPRGPSRGNPTPKNTRTHERRCCGRSSGKAAEPAIAVSPIVERDCGLGGGLAALSFDGPTSRRLVADRRLIVKEVGSTSIHVGFTSAHFRSIPPQPPTTNR